MAERVAPPINWLAAILVAVLIIVAGVAAWEVAMRREGLRAGDLGSNDSNWARERRRVDADPAATVIVGSSRLLFNVDTVLWGQLTGKHPIQLSREGTNPRPVLSDLAKDRAFRGLVIVGYDPMVFWGRGAAAARLVEAAKEEPLFKRTGLILHEELSRVFAFFDDRMNPVGWLEHLDVPQRTARGGFNQPWKLLEMGDGRDSWMWPRVETDRAYREKAASIWLLPPPPWVKPTTAADKAKIITEIVRDVKAIRARGGDVIFVRSPSDRPLLDIETRVHPREQTWDRMIAAARTRGIYWSDDPVLSRLRTVELSHLSRADRAPFTRRLVQLIYRQSP